MWGPRGCARAVKGAFIAQNSYERQESSVSCTARGERRPGLVRGNCSPTEAPDTTLPRPSAGRASFRKEPGTDDLHKNPSSTIETTVRLREGREGGAGFRRGRTRGGLPALFTTLSRGSPRIPDLHHWDGAPTDQYQAGGVLPRPGVSPVSPWALAPHLGARHAGQLFVRDPARRVESEAPMRPAPPGARGQVPPSPVGPVARDPRGRAVPAVPGRLPRATLAARLEGGGSPSAVATL